MSRGMRWARYRPDPRGWILPILVLAAWQYQSGGDAAHAYAFTPLPQVWAAARAIVGNGELWLNTAASIERTLAGFLLGSLAAVALALAMTRWHGLSRLLNPLLQAVRQAPVLGLAPLIGFWLGNGEVSKRFIIALAAFYPVLLNSYEGMRQVDGKYRELGRIYGFGPWRQLFRITAPGGMPGILTGVQQAIPIAWITAYGSELMFNAGEGLGSLMMVAESNARMDILLVCALTVTLSGVAMTGAFRVIENHVLIRRGNV